MQLLTTQPELFPYMTRLSPGQNALADPMKGSIQELRDLYYRGSAFYTMGSLALPPADAALDLHNLTIFGPSPTDDIGSTDSKILALAARAQARKAEMSAIWEMTLRRSEVIRATQDLQPEFNLVSVPRVYMLHLYVPCLAFAWATKSWGRR